MNNFVNVVLGVLLLGCLAAIFVPLIAQHSSRQNKEITFKNVERIIMQSEDRWIFLRQSPENHKVIDTVSVSARASKGVKIIKDAPENESCWIELYGFTDGSHYWCDDLKIHIHDAKEINPGASRVGKFGKGHNEVVE